MVRATNSLPVPVSPVMSTVGVPGHAVHHTHELVHERAGNQKLRPVDFTPCQWDRPSCNCALRRRKHISHNLVPSGLDRKTQNAGRSCIGIAQQRQTKVNIDVTAGLSTAAEFAFEPSFLDNQSNRAAGQERLLFNTIKVGYVSANPVLGHNAISIGTLVTAGDDSLEVSREDRVL